jgi:hypothetical protein
LNGLTFQSHDAATDEVVEVEISSLLNRDSPRLIFKHSDVVFIFVHVPAIQELAFLVEELFLAKNTHNVLQNAWLEFLLFEQSPDDHSLLKWLNIQDVVHNLYVSLVNLPFHRSGVLHHWAQFVKSQKVDCSILKHLLFRLSFDHVFLVVHHVRWIGLSHQTAVCSLLTLVLFV